MSDQVVVTIKIGNVMRDYALPLHVKMGELYSRLLAVLRNSDPKAVNRADRIILQSDSGYLSEESATLADYGIRDGAVLTVHMEETHG